MDYKFAGDFTKAALGPFTAAEKKKVWSDPLATNGGVNWDPDPEGKFYSVIEDDRFSGGRACRCKYTKGAYGMGNQTYQVLYRSPQTIANLEFTWLFEADFDLAPPNDQQQGGGKIGPCISWGAIGGPNELRGTRPMIWWNGNGSLYLKPVFSPVCQDQRSGNQLVKPAVYTQKIATEVLYKWRIQCMGGENGYARYWLDDVMVADTGKQLLQLSASDDVYFDFAFFAGGGAHQAPRWDSYARHGSIRMWSGEAYWEATNPVPPQPEPAPGASFTIEIAGETYALEGSARLVKLT